MGIGGISVWQLLIVLAIVIMLFGTKRLRTLGGDLGSAIKGFKKSMQDDEDKASSDDEAEDDAPFSASLPRDEPAPSSYDGTRDQAREEQRGEDATTTGNGGERKP